jgi:YD repeat-containing protein
VRGNLTNPAACRLDGAGNCNWINHARTFDIAGNLVKQYEANSGSFTVFGYNGDGQNRYAFVTSATNALGQTTYAAYDYNSGKLIQSTDLNGVNTTYAYQDALDRLTQIRRAAGGGAGLESQTNYNYPNPNQVIRYQDLNSTGDAGLRNDSYYDGLGRERASSMGTLRARLKPTRVTTRWGECPR